MADALPIPAFHFKVEFEVDGVTRQDQWFQEVSGLTAELSVESLEEGGENRFSHRLPGRATYPNLVLKRGMITDSGLIDWFKDAVQSMDIKPAGVRVSLLNEKAEPLVSWSFVSAWPVKWAVSNLAAGTNALAVDTVELAYQYFERV